MYGIRRQRRDPCFLRLARHPNCHLPRPAIGPSKIRNRHQMMALLVQLTAVVLPLQRFNIAGHNLDAVQQLRTPLAFELNVLRNDQV